MFSEQQSHALDVSPKRGGGGLLFASCVATCKVSSNEGQLLEDLAVSQKWVSILEP